MRKNDTELLMENNTRFMSLWLSISHCSMKLRFESLFDMYVATLGVSWLLRGILMNSV